VDNIQIDKPMSSLVAKNRKWLVPAAKTACWVALALAAYWMAVKITPAGVNPGSVPSWIRSPVGTVLFFAGGGYLLFRGLFLRQRVRESADWPTIDGEVVENREVTVRRYVRVPAVICSYVVHGRKYMSDQILLPGGRDGEWFTPGKRLELRYDPAEPSVVVAGAAEADATDTTVLGALALAGPSFLAFLALVP